MTETTTQSNPVGWPELRDRPPDAELLAMLETRSLNSLDAGELVDVIAAAKRLTTRCEALGLSAADTLRRQMAAEDPDLEADPRSDPTKFAAIEVAAATHETKYRASCRLHQVRNLSTGLPRVWDLVKQGRLDLYSADQIQGELVPVVDRSLIPGLEQQIVDGLLASTPADSARANAFGLVGTNPTRTRALARRLVAKAQPGHTDEQFKRSYSQRRLVTDDDGDGMANLWLSHSVDRVTGIKHRLGLIARSLPGDDPRTMDQKVADLTADILEGKLVVDTCTSLLEEGADPGMRRTAARRRIQINVTVSIQTLMGLSDTPGQTLTGQVVPASLVRQLAADADAVWYRMLTDHGRFVELSTHTYTPTAALRRSTVTRDRTCVGVGCNQPADTADHDHTHAWLDHGETKESNLGPGCRTHHNSKDNDGPFALDQPEPGLFRWTYPSGHSYTTTAEDYFEADWPHESAIPAASPADITEGLALLETKRRRLAAEQCWRDTRPVIERRIAQWHHETAEADETRDDTNDYPPIPTEILESWAA